MESEPLAVEYANTLYAVRGDLREGLDTAAALTAWLREHAVADLDAADLAPFVALRDAVRDLARAVVTDQPAPREALETLNASAARAPRWPTLHADGQVVERTAAAPDQAALATLARAAVDLFAGPDRALLRACGGPGCVLFFVKRPPRREWCSASCGNRARVGRYYRRHHAAED
ncbi:hypothetical protein Lfu02_12520 [Longispora fulva]|uniref:Putative RNA-binding Zn ribbon-like protein n=1 Tax=Longispora fulva TaxID=619741 RepID=A0A8J7GFD9_9ACTN|nr:ABATE domain-containing protein [Longispora fulva]MBG6134888.1 putative RNA-binding Zn ribbon-like protein [Longispora fulva]GIG56880.1 hypothetical protein Lfu02_12520 [Longispora fulva]